jgi:hypothetical protein
MANINILRIQTRLREMFDGKIDLTDCSNDISNHFDTRAIAALTLMLKCGLDAEQAGRCITDGSHDLGIDALYLDNSQKKLFVVQSKWRNDGNGSISQEEMQTFIEGIKRLLNFDLDGANQKILAKKTDIDFGISQIGYQINLVFSHTGNMYIPDYAKRPLTDLMSTTNDDVSTLLLFEELTFREIYAFLAEGQNPETINLDDVILSNWGKIDAPYSAYYGIISAAAVGEWFNTYGNSLFAKNIRFYKGSTDVNDGIKRVLLQEPENFVYYNNGIKVLCNTIERKAKGSTTTVTGLFSLSGVSLVNGAQTTGTIGSVYAQDPEQVAKANVMIQIIDLSNATDDAVAQITKLSNTQNRIDSKDFASLDFQQERLRTELAFAHILYLYKSGDTLTDPEHQISFDEAIVALACWHEELSYATLAKRNVGGLSEDINKAPYKVLFNSGTNSYVLINSVKAIRKIEAYLQTKKEQTTGRERLVCVHANRFISYCVIQSLKSEPNYEKAIFESDYLDELITPIINEKLPQIILQMNTLYADSYPANIFKNTGKCKEIYRQLTLENDHLD